MTGNLTEWVNDWKDSTRGYVYYWHLPDARYNPKGAPTGISKLVQGAHYLDFGIRVFVYVGMGGGAPYSNRSPLLGVRCAY
ncbi:MAG: hypothetical protein JNL74_17920 [Fibrobacteres bacterium]|nr:hypothetical protein [Fibrobacterota bacterium]